MIALTYTHHSIVNTSIYMHYSIFMYVWFRQNELLKHKGLLVNKVHFHFALSGVAVGSLETCTHVIPMPEPYNLALVFMGIYVPFFIIFDMHKL